MRLLSLDIAEFRNLRRRSFPMSPEWNLIIGGNDAGKTNVLEAAALALQSLVPAWTGRQLEQDAQDALRAQVAVEWGETEYAWRTGEELPPLLIGKEERSPGAEALRSRLQLAVEKHLDLPAIAYYRSTSLRRSSFAPGVDPDSRLSALANGMALDAGSVLERMRPLVAAPVSTRDAVLRQAIERVLSECVFPPDSVRLASDEGRLSVSLDGGPPKPVESYGAGVLRLLTIAADLAYRCCVLNPHLGADAALRTSGIVLIDDLELHLHPKRQRSLVEDLAQVFPEMQFLATSHSPFLVQSIHAGQVIDLDGRATSEAPELSIEDIAEGIMGIRIPQRSKRYLDMNAAAKEAAGLIRSADGATEEKRREIRDRLNRLSMPFSNNQAFHAFLSMERLEAGLFEEGD